MRVSRGWNFTPPVIGQILIPIRGENRDTQDLKITGIDVSTYQSGRSFFKGKAGIRRIKEVGPKRQRPFLKSLYRNTGEVRG